MLVNVATFSALGCGKSSARKTITDAKGTLFVPVADRSGINVKSCLSYSNARDILLQLKQECS